MNEPILTLSQLSHSSPHFSVDLKHNQNSISITLQTSILSTKELLQTETILNQLLPSIYAHKCFNDHNYSFKKEVLNTQLGHFFEHVFMEYMYQHLNLTKERDKTVINGLTTWDWNKQIKGIFNIEISTEYIHPETVKIALDQSIKLLNTLLATTRQHTLIS